MREWLKRLAWKACALERVPRVRISPPPDTIQMKKLFKILVILLTLSGILFASGILILKKLLPPEKVKERISKEVAARFNRQIEVGKIQIGLFQGIVIEDFALSESPNFKSGKFIESKKFSLKFQIWPLLKKKVIVNQIELQKPKIRIIKNADGKTFNFSDLVKPSAPAASSQALPKEEANSPLAITISKAVISEGKVEFIDRTAQKMKITLSPINLTASSTGLDKPMKVKLSFNLDSFLLGKDLRGKLEVSSVLELPNETVEIESLLWTMDLLTLETKGRIENFKNPKIDLELSLSKLDMKALTQWAPLPKEIKISVSPTLNLSLKGTQELLNYSAKIQLSQIETEIKGSIKNSPHSDPTIKAAFKTNSFDLKEIEKLTDLGHPYAPAGTVSLVGEVSGPLKLLRAKGTLNLENVQAKYEKIQLQSLQGKVEFTENSLNVPSLTGVLTSAGKVPCEFQIKTIVKNFLKPEIFLEANLSALDLNLFLSDKKKESGKEKIGTPKQTETAKSYKGPEIRAEGKLTIGKLLYTKFEGEKFEAHWNLSGITPSLDRLDGNTTVEMRQGKIADVPLLPALSPHFKTDSSSFGFSYLGGHWAIAKGTAKTEDFKVLSPTADIFVKGSISLPQRKPDLILTARLPKGSLSGTLAEFSSDPEGRPTFVFFLKNNWKPSLDTAQVQKKAVEKGKEEIKKKASEFLEKEGKKLLEGLFKK